MLSPAARLLREARLSADLTQQELAERTGVRQPNIAAYEGGQRRPSEAMLRRLLAAARPRPSVALDTHRDEVRRLVKQHHGTNARVFGSVARGTDGPDSDLDLLITFDDQASLLDQSALVDALTDLLQVRVDVVSERGLADRDEMLRGEAVPV